MKPTPASVEPADVAASFCAALVDEWVRGGVVHAVVAPGSRSTPLALALARHPGVSVHLFHDERSASFAALGIGRATGMPAVLLCTSGTAAAQFHAAVVEADLSDVPMLVCTADRPPEARDVSSPQTIDQTHLYGRATRWFHDPGVPAIAAVATWRPLASRALARSCGHRPGPVHLNLPFREPLLGSATCVPEAREGAWSRAGSVLVPDESVLAEVASILSGRRGIVVAGAGSTPGVLALARSLGWPVLADPSSGLRVEDDRVVCAFDPILRVQSFADSHPPDVVVRVGDPPASKVLSQWVESLDAVLVQISPTDRVVDPSHRVRFLLAGDVEATATGISHLVEPVDPTWSLGWSRAESAARGAIASWTSANHGEPTVAAAVAASALPGSNIVVSSSMPVRDLEWFGGPMPAVRVHANRGANGIDGVVSTAVGVALASSSPTTLLIGDIAFVHDSNGLWSLTARGVDLDIVVVNNDGGSIFSFLPQRAGVADDVFENLWGTPHGSSLASLAAAHRIEHVLVEDARSLPAVLGSRGVRVIEVVTERASNVAAHDAINSAVAAALAAL